jgi:hypothetical protein
MPKRKRGFWRDILYECRLTLWSELFNLAFDVMPYGPEKVALCRWVSPMMKEQAKMAHEKMYITYAERQARRDEDPRRSQKG